MQQKALTKLPNKKVYEKAKEQVDQKKDNPYNC